MSKKLKCRSISDVHGKFNQLEIVECDMLIVAGDMGTVRDPIESNRVIRNFLEWLYFYPAKYKVVIPGNHDLAIERNYVTVDDFAEKGVTLLNHTSITIEEINIFGSPYTPTFGDGWAFNKDRSKISRYWDMIPEYTDILITHGPPLGVLDATSYKAKEINRCGCRALYNKVREIQPKYHIFGHIHPEDNNPNAGMMKIAGCNTTFINAAVLDLNYNIDNQGYTFDF